MVLHMGMTFYKVSNWLIPSYKDQGVHTKLNDALYGIVCGGTAWSC